MNTPIENNVKRVPKVLFGVIIVVFIPFVISYILLDNDSLITSLLAVAYVIQVLLILFAFLGKKQKFHLLIIVITIGLLMFQFMTLSIDLMLGIEINRYDVINTFAKALNFFLLFGLMIEIRVRKIHIIHFMRYLLIFSIIACLYNLVVNWSNIIQFGNITSSYQLELKSFFANRNQFGSFLFISIVAYYYFISGRSTKKMNIMILMLQIINIVLTMSRGAILASAVFVTILYIQHLKKLRVVISIVVLFLISGIILTINSGIISFVTRYIIRADMGVSGRVQIWEMGLNIAIQNNIINGVGFHTALDLSKKQGFIHNQFHSLFIDTLASGGVIELLFIIVLLAYILRRCIRKCNDFGYRKIYIASVIAVLILSIFESVSFFSIGYVDTIFTVFFISIPLLLSNMEYKD